MLTHMPALLLFCCWFIPFTPPWPCLLWTAVRTVFFFFLRYLPPACCRCFPTPYAARCCVIPSFFFLFVPACCVYRCRNTVYHGSAVVLPHTRIHRTVPPRTSVTCVLYARAQRNAPPVPLPYPTCYLLPHLLLSIPMTRCHPPRCQHTTFSASYAGAPSHAYLLLLHRLPACTCSHGTITALLYRLLLPHIGRPSPTAHPRYMVALRGISANRTAFLVIYLHSLPYCSSFALRTRVTVLLLHCLYDAPG